MKTFVTILMPAFHDSRLVLIFAGLTFVDRYLNRALRICVLYYKSRAQASSPIQFNSTREFHSSGGPAVRGKALGRDETYQ